MTLRLPGQLLIFMQDVEYLSPIIKAIEAEQKERFDLDALVIKKRSA